MYRVRFADLFDGFRNPLRLDRHRVQVGVVVPAFLIGSEFRDPFHAGVIRPAFNLQTVGVQTRQEIVQKGA